MKTLYILFASCVFLMFCVLEFRGVSWDTNETAPRPQAFSSRGSSGGGSYFFFSSK